VLGWGYGEDGQLGHGDTNDSLSPKEVQYFTRQGLRAAFIAAGHSHSGAIVEGGSLYMWGCNPDSRLMIEDNENRVLPSLTILEQAKEHFQEKEGTGELYEPFSLSLGVTHSAIVTRGGDLITCGSKMDGQLGVKFSDFSSKEQMAAPFNKVVLFGPHHKAVQAACGDSFTLVLDDQGKVYAFGKGAHGKLGIGQMKGEGGELVGEPIQLDALKGEKVVQISAGCRHSACTTGKFPQFIQ